MLGRVILNTEQKVKESQSQRDKAFFGKGGIIRGDFRFDCFLQESLEETDGGVLEVQRNDLAQRFNCVPSQINYVMSTRFSPERGYIVESRRGGNGYIRITRVRVDRQTLLMQVINTLGSQVDLASARAILNNLVQAGALEENAGRSILAAVGDKALAAVPRESRDTVRADIMKQVLILQV